MLIFFIIIIIINKLTIYELDFSIILIYLVADILGLTLKLVLGLRNQLNILAPGGASQQLS